MLQNPIRGHPVTSQNITVKVKVKERGKKMLDAGTAVDLTVPMEDYHECVRLVREYRRALPLKKLPIGRKISSKLLLREKLLAIPSSNFAWRKYLPRVVTL